MRLKCQYWPLLYRYAINTFDFRACDTCNASGYHTTCYELLETWTQRLTTAQHQAIVRIAIPVQIYVPDLVSSSVQTYFDQICDLRVLSRPACGNTYKYNGRLYQKELWLLCIGRTTFTKQAIQNIILKEPGVWIRFPPFTLESTRVTITMTKSPPKMDFGRSSRLQDDDLDHIHSVRLTWVIRNRSLRKNVPFLSMANWRRYLPRT